MKLLGVDLDALRDPRGRAYSFTFDIAGAYYRIQVACHARAAFGKGVLASYNPKDPTTADPNGFEASPNDKNDPAFQTGTVALHRIWTIFTRAQ